MRLYQLCPDSLSCISCVSFEIRMTDSVHPPSDIGSAPCQQRDAIELTPHDDSAGRVLFQRRSQPPVDTPEHGSVWGRSGAGKDFFTARV